MNDILTGIFSTLGALAILFASIGILRMPDFYLRLSVSVKASTLGVGFLLACAAFISPDVSVTTKAMSIVFFLILTAPVAGHMISRTAYHTNIPTWEGTVLDELKGEYDKIDRPIEQLGHPRAENDAEAQSNKGELK